jgi:hypothetical protein
LLTATSYYAAAIVFGLALGVHHVTVALVLPALAVLVYETQGLSFFASKRLLFAAVVSVAALLAVYSYLPLAAAHNPILNWGDPRSLGAIWAHVSGKQYQVFLSFSPSIIGEQLPQFLHFLFREFGTPWIPIALVAAIAGFVATWRRDRTTFFWLVLIVLGNLAYTMNYEIAEDKDAYYLPVFVAITIAAGIGFHSFLEFTFAKRSSTAGRLFISSTVALVPAVALATNWPIQQSQPLLHRTITWRIFKRRSNQTACAHARLAGYSPILYTREIEERRRGHQVVTCFAARCGKLDYLRRVYPDLVERSRWSRPASRNRGLGRDPGLSEQSIVTQDINNSFQRMLQSFVTKELEVAPVYVTDELYVMRESQEIDLIQWLNHSFQAVPRGLVFQLFHDSEFHDPGEWHLQTRGLTDGTLKFEDDDVVKIKVIPTYRAMLEDRGLYLAHFNQQERAAAALEQARQF